MRKNLKHSLSKAVSVIAVILSLSILSSIMCFAIAKSYDTITPVKNNPFSVKDPEGYKMTAFEGMSVGEKYAYSIKISTSHNKEKYAAVFRTKLPTKDTIKEDTIKFKAVGDHTTKDGYFTDYILGHANDVTSTILSDNKVHLFIAYGNGKNECPNKKRDKIVRDVVELKIDGTKISYVGSYYVDKNINVYGIQVVKKDLKNGKLDLILKNGGSTCYKAVAYLNKNHNRLSNKKITVKDSCTFNYGKYSNYSTQGFSYSSKTKKIYVPLSQDKKSVILIYDYKNAFKSNKISPSNVYNLHTEYYNELEIECAGICNTDGKLYFNANRRKGTVQSDIIGCVN